MFCLQLDETFSVVLSSHSTPASRLGNRRQVNITVRKSDDPFGVIEFIQSGLDFTINESKAMDVQSGTEIFKLQLWVTLLSYLLVLVVFQFKITLRYDL